MFILVQKISNKTCIISKKYSKINKKRDYTNKFAKHVYTQNNLFKKLVLKDVYTCIKAY
jgi:hypothetical protein